MTKVKDEVAKIVGPNKKLEENDFHNLPYLQAVIKETLCLHPPGPLLVPRRARQDLDFMGYHIPKNTQVLVNVWAIGKDSEYWDDPLSFKPERFLTLKFDLKGQHFEYLPFGANRRSCPGLPVAQPFGYQINQHESHSKYWDDPLSFKPERILTSKIDFNGQHFEYLPFGTGRRTCPGLPVARLTCLLFWVHCFTNSTGNLRITLQIDEEMDLNEKMGPLNLRATPNKRMRQRGALEGHAERTPSVTWLLYEKNNLRIPNLLHVKIVKIDVGFSTARLRATECD
ncbi:hypothetical protein LguiB_016926 [Lonicera macranthoides]